MAMAKKGDSGIGSIVWTIVLLFLGVLVLIVLFLPKDTTSFFLSANQSIEDFFSSEWFLGLRTISGVIIVALSGFITWLFFKLLEMEKEHEDHVYHHADHAEEKNHSHLHRKTQLTEKKQIHTNKVDQSMPHELHTEEVEHTREKTAPPPVRLPGESGVRGVPVGEERPGHTQWQSVLRLATSVNPSDWKLAIIEADVILDMMTYMQGIPGDTLGERLKNAEPGLFKNLDYAKKAHYVRNRIAHDGNTEFTGREVQQVIRMYEEVLKEFKYI